MAKYMAIVIKCGDTYEAIVKRAVPRGQKRGRRNRGSMPQWARDRNDRIAGRHLARIVNGNFRPSDLWLSILRDDLPPTDSIADGDELERHRIAAHREAQAYIRRIKYHAEKRGIDPAAIKWILQTTYVKGDTGELTQIHHHIIITALPRDIIADCWASRNVDVRHLRNQGDYTALATYIVRQGVRLPDAKKYTTSRNMSQPEIISETLVDDPTAPIKLPKGAIVMHRDEYDAERPRQYVRYVWRGPEKKRRKSE